MSTDFPRYLFSFVWPVAFLMLLFCVVFRPRRLRRHPGGWLFGMGVLAMGIVWFPVGGLPLGRWFTGLSANFSLPLLALIADAIGRRVCNAELLGQNGTRAATGFGAVAGILLYPMALGLGPVDPYALGWSFGWLFAATGALTATWLWRGNRFGLVLLAAIVAYDLRLQESNNYWDYLVDPVYFLISLVAVSRQWVQFASSRRFARERS